jgi:hypothetical protein
MGNVLVDVLQSSILQTEDSGNDSICLYLIILGIVLVILYISLYLYNRFHLGKKTKQHPCKYCGHIQDVVSNCCHAPVVEKFMTGKCSKCGKECKVICSRCKRGLY